MSADPQMSPPRLLSLLGCFFPKSSLNSCLGGRIVPQLEDQATNVKLVDLLDYVEQVVRLDENVAMRLADYRLPDKTTFALLEAELRNLPGVRHNNSDDEGAIWLQVERLTRQPPPIPPD